jgi:hypothetical protein
MEEVASSRVSPSGAALATTSAAGTPPAPGRLSTTTGRPIRCEKPGAQSRASPSVAPPAGKGTTRRAVRCA